LLEYCLRSLRSVHQGRVSAEEISSLASSESIWKFII
jgi:hypothetical protein